MQIQRHETGPRFSEMTIASFGDSKLFWGHQISVAGNLATGATRATV